MKLMCLSSLLLFGLLGIGEALDNGLNKTPQMGWNSWNFFHCNVSETLIKETADAFANLGLNNYGYTFVNIDDCWAKSRDLFGNIVEDFNSFPSGMKALAAYVHSKGLKFGVYSDAGEKTCAGRPGSLGHETNDARSYAHWEIDYLKYDNCYDDGIKPETRYPIMRDALNKTGRPILFSLCEWGVDDPATWAGEVGNSWRTTGDITTTWDSIMSNIMLNNKWWAQAGPGAWNDPDILEVGNPGLNYDQYVSHFSLWALAKAPLLIGCDVRALKKGDPIFEILTNQEVIAINQDPLGVQGRLVSKSRTHQVWAGPISGGSTAVVLLNISQTANTTIYLRFEDLGISKKSSVSVRDLWQHKDLGVFQDAEYSVTLNPFASVTLKVTLVK